jgi:two-component system, OmpR family, phosphate regulon response regulator PhoB
MRSLVFRFDDLHALELALDRDDASLRLAPDHAVRAGEWVLAIFEVGTKRRVTASAAFIRESATGEPFASFEKRDWARLQTFVTARSEHMRVARPISTTPRAPSVAPASAEPSSAPPSGVDSVRVAAGARVLLVDDDADARDEVRGMLASLGLEVVVVSDPDEARRAMAEQTFDAMVVDWDMPGMHPLDFVLSVRKTPKHAAIPVLFLADQPSSRAAVDAFAGGADDFLPKPLRAPELAARILGLIRRARLALAAQLAPASVRGGGL